MSTVMLDLFLEFTIEIFVNFDICVPKSFQTNPIFSSMLFNLLSVSLLGILGNLMVRYHKLIYMYKKIYF
jgi:hypothetical protein